MSARRGRAGNIRGQSAVREPSPRYLRRPEMPSRLTQCYSASQMAIPEKCTLDIDYCSPGHIEVSSASQPSKRLASTCDEHDGAHKFEPSPPISYYHLEEVFRFQACSRRERQTPVPVLTDSFEMNQRLKDLWYCLFPAEAARREDRPCGYRQYSVRHACKSYP